MPRSLDQDFAAAKVGVITPDIWNQLLRSIELRLKRQENRETSVDAALADLVAVGLARINEVLTPAITTINAVAELGFLTAASSSPQSLADPDATLVWIVPAGDQRDLFRPAPFCIVQANDDPDSWALIKNANYIRANGALYGDIYAVGPDADTVTSFDDWSIGALAGSTLAQLTLLEQGEALQAGIEANAEQVSTDKNAVLAAVAQVAAALAAIEEGPVASVVGLTGIITAAALKTALAIAIGDVSGLSAALAAKATPADITTAINNLKAGVGSALDTLNELAAALGNDANFAATMTTALASKASTSAIPSRGKIVALAYGDGLGF